jgi:hypothetical protein
MAYKVDENGKYKRTVRCSHCYEIGHNRSSCPQLRQSLRDSIAETKARMDKGEWKSNWEETQTRRRFEWATNQLHKMESRGKNRKCGFCGDHGHTRRTCQERKDKTAEMLKKTLDIRERMRDSLEDIGCAPGALVNVSVRDSRFPNGVLGVVTSISLKDIYHANVYDGGQWGPSYKQNVKVKLLHTVKDYWGSEYDEVKALMPSQVINIDNHEMHEGCIASMRDRENYISVVSPIDCDENSFDSNDFDNKLVSKWVLENIVDP